ncbi:unnamed protein product (macronuclear) [Paramecium tetraurelia]|uniref:Polyadenylate-binding protein n=1 Tax=Paramecium tetraurelia TaxID=5888 RepID=A0BHJ6_PARTE|nr:uncharacterized protein GSPATT00029048001 [Paramecium tetraurelia]CAK58013.1 unnamed protein product [Paramecium tetraurelia]|eukprot:XP_001425411.1 hypothetical protein (macronuclear) [Paramecium tetraurelia strain d4-2]
MQIGQQDLPKNKTTEQQKNIIFIENLDKAITEDFLFHQFKRFGDISIIKLMKDKHKNISCGQATITYSDAASAEKARQTLDNQKLINNIIKVKPYINFNDTEKDANIYMKNLPKQVKIEDLEQELSKYGSILSIEIRRDAKGNQLNYGYVQFEKKDDAKLFLEQINQNPFIYQGNEIHFELFKSQSERAQQSNELFLRGFSNPLSQNIIQQDKTIAAIEYGWQMVIKDYFQKQQNIQIQSCFVKFDKNTRQPWAMIKFEHSDQAKAQCIICESQRTHPCVQSNILYALQLIQQSDIKQANFSELKLSLQEIVSIYENLANHKFDIFSGVSDNFFYNLKQDKSQTIDERQLYIQNINGSLHKDDIQAFLSSFGNVISVTMRQSTKPYTQLQDCIVLYQTIYDAKLALSQIYDRKYSQSVKHIFKNGIIKISVFLGKNLRQEYQQMKKKRKRLIYKPMMIQLPQPPFLQLQKPLIQNHPFNQEPINNFFPLIKKYGTIEIIKNQMSDFSKLTTSDQRMILGNLLFNKVQKKVQDKGVANHIVGMLIEPSSFTISDIFDFFENDQDLNDYIEDGLELIKENQQKIK